MPVIQQENGIKSVKGLPHRWGAKAYQELKAASSQPDSYQRLSAMLDQVTDAPLPIDATDAQLCIKAQQCAQACQRQADTIHDIDALRERMAHICQQNGILPPEQDKARQVVARCIDAAWWRRQLRKVHGRAFEHAAIRLGYVSSRTGSYVSDETVKRRMQQNKRNAKILESVTLQNNLDQSYKLSELALKSTANKANRRGELMTRIKGLETIAQELQHDALFITPTCPSKYHAVIQGTGKMNPKYQDKTPAEAQAYLCQVWARFRAAIAREGITLYGVRIAEPHHDGCTHWHMCLFIQPAPGKSQAWAKSRVKRLYRRYAWAEDRGEPGAFAQRIKFVDIDPSKGDAAGYCAKYVSKNIDDEHVGTHIQDGEEVKTDLTGSEKIKACHRVEAWAAVWGIRQFQMIGSAPVTVWRELRRVQEATIKNSPGYIQDAWKAAQKISQKNAEGEEIETLKAADFAGYLRAQGGVAKGRNYKIAVATREAEIEGRYGLALGKKPVGVYSKANKNAVYESVRYTWRRSGGGVAFDVPRTRVNNCTQDAHAFDGPHQPIAAFDCEEWFDSLEAEQVLFADSIDIDAEVERHRQQAEERKKNTVWTHSRTSDLLEKRAGHGRRTGTTA